ncbi:hypothetical protein EYF80_012993 [Liparis tanakae]|uniref:Uncharacterized protein n=1 Tax=Liparis tanakae TaxID=230148 RepID=A0A4Z2IH23_9TELE|nr:hypothetical protein EYF80_012993 [Liparis tanakae]
MEADGETSLHPEFGVLPEDPREDTAGQELPGCRRRVTDGSLLSQQELGGSRGREGGQALPPAAVHRLLVGGEGDWKSVHHQVQLV